MNILNVLARRIRRLAGRAQIRRVTYANKRRYFQIIQEGGAPLDDVEHLEPFGFTSHPLQNAETVVLAFNGNGSHSVAIVAGDQRYRLEIEEGEAAMYNNFGDKVHIKKDRTISIEAAVKVIIDTPHTHMTGKLTVAQSIAAVGFITSDDYMKAATNINAGANITAVGIVKGASLTNTAGSASMASDGKMTVSDVFIDGVSHKIHYHIDAEGRPVGGPL